jgi:hypothetical protein
VSRTLGEAFVPITATGEREFGIDARRMVDTATRTLKAAIPVTADTRGAMTELARLQAQSAALAKSLAGMTATVDDGKAKASITTLQGLAGKLAAELKDMPADVDPTAAAADLAKLQLVTDKLTASLRDMPATVDPTRADTTIAGMRTRTADLAASLRDMLASVDDKGARASLLGMQVQADKLARRLSRMPVDADTRPAEAALLRLEHRELTIKAKVDVDQGFLSRLLPGYGGGGGRELPSGLISGAVSGGGAVTGGLLGGIPLVGGALAAAPFPAQVGVLGAGALAAPFLAEMLGGGLVSGLGAGLAGLGIYGATKAAGAGAASPQQVAAAHDQLHAAQLRVTAAQERLNKLQESGKATAGQLASAQAGLASAQGSVASAQDRVNKLETGQKVSQQARQMTGALHALTESWNRDLADIGKPFLPVLTSVFDTARKVFDRLTPFLTNVMKTLAKPLQDFGDMLVNVLGQPAVQYSLQRVADAFGDILKAVTPQLSQDIFYIADGITSIADAIAAHPQAFADFIGFLFKLTGWALQAIGGLTRLAIYMETTFRKNLHGLAHAFDEARHGIAEQWDLMRHDVAHTWDLMWQHTIGAAIRAQAHLQTLISGWLHDFAHWFDVARHDVAAAWDGLWNDVRSIWDGAVRDVWNPVKTFVTGTVPGWFRDAVSGIGVAWSGIVDKVRGPVNTVIDVLNGLVSAFNTITGFLHIPLHIPPIGHVGGGPGGSGGSPPVLPPGGLAAGGFITAGTGPTADDVLIRASRGELVVPAWAVSAGLADHMRGLIPGFQGGGQVLPGAGSRLGPIPGVAGVAGSLGSFVPPGAGRAADAAGVVVALATGQTGPAESALARMAGLPAAGGTGLAGMLSALPWKLLTSMVKWLGDHLFSAITGGGGGGGGTPVGNIGGGVQRWAPLVLTALAMEGLSASLLPLVLRQMQSESGGNPNAINLTDINAQRGDPSRGLLQTIMSTFLRWHWPGTSFNIYDPLANIAAAINYSAHGRGFGTGPGQMGSMHGYARGGLVGGFQAGGPVGDLRDALAAAQAGERAKYFGLTHSLALDLAHPQAGSYAHAHAASIRHELATLAGKQKAEELAYRHLGGSGLTTPHLRDLMKAAESESRTALGTALGHQHPLWNKDLRRFLGQLENLGARGMPPGYDWTGAITLLQAFAPGLFSNAPSSPFVSYSFDRGGWLPPGTSVVHNATGQPERVVPPGGDGPMTESTGRAICARLDALISLTRAGPAAYSQALSGVAGAAASRGYYGGR